MAEGFTIDPARIRSCIPTFATQAENLRVAAEMFRVELARLGAPWGNDDNGRKFGVDFLAQQDIIVSACTNMAQGIASVSPTLTAIADNTVHTDKTNATGLS